MDIFTTALTRFLPVPIKPANLKVKALLKEAGASKLKEDLNHLENHDYYFNNDKNKQEEDAQDKNSKTDQAESESTNFDSTKSDSTKSDSTKSADKKHKGNTDEAITESKDGVKHLDLYI